MPLPKVGAEEFLKRAEEIRLDYVKYRAADPRMEEYHYGVAVAHLKALGMTAGDAVQWLARSRPKAWS